MRKYFIHTMGCQMNEYDSLRIAAVFDKIGFTEAEEMEEGDYLIVNTCSVREKPQHKAESAIGRFRQIKRRRPEVKIGFCGCVAQQEGENLLKTNKDIDFVVGTDGLHRLEEVVAHVEAGERLSDTQVNEGGLEIDIFNREVSVSSFVTIMKGCNNFCSYCIVPYVRGREKSREQSEIIDEIKYLADKGAREITLLGQNVNSYGTALTDPVSFPELLDKVSDVEGIKRIRFVTSHPKDFSNELIDVMRGNDKICEYLHLPLQSGSNAVLQKMNRKYTYDHYKERVLRAKEMIPDLALSSDFIVGFPGETEEDFQSTMKALEEIRYDMIYAFNYSTRPGTKAESFNDDVPLEVKKMRLAKLLDAQKRIIAENSAAYQDLVVEVMVEGESKKGAGQYSGRNRQNRVVNFSSETILSSGDFVNVKITEPRPNSLLGERV
ncbi:RNA modification enzyme, MiaB family [Denitrovibrio acetiphilus DSM 12809]|uniref:tRNA-2-methylthio-N(6)-dimethylallyladenosine synthase n=1 Tax=Denitrovibrio acetiphilus (strain DSM 12809 / NBRC 114555 / N2460) TaxID=522772 RepID=D4H0V0_DENA2|nr:tRNA (N6-isopentenyl adenosine(37)-C2)-methylthiotransferase MiaB [Denitrovibrio acetiphilus]ADD68613.1 RNA modification enzyme, MiaB family [Denitrovibrio acetiphilus DSM 12809]